MTVNKTYHFGVGARVKVNTIGFIAAGAGEIIKIVKNLHMHILSQPLRECNTLSVYFYHEGHEGGGARRTFFQRRVQMDVSRKAIGKRFENFRKALRRTIHELAEEIHTSPDTILQIETGDISPPYAIPFIMYEKHGLNINWLLMGEGEMFHYLSKTSMITKRRYQNDYKHG